ncbi:cobyrinic acid ac-diamide synthase [Halosimplex carlsbadense 2-9-1]|uniref:Cobyrinic acid ac-diamide synthase n=1 Tax=Halosimplex carlsbadense 2-9-1 TaxID=797114 RepID=M0D1W9_9EURY|nr:cobyrinic acid a,c-diamide synthase [Halosimplex carlsbadense]ELZ28858.1 cobyrinic acid ac-diamide synthase [Halosimplex carlsbadense 2-9-1]
MILAVVGGKGGVGKSTVAYNLGSELDAVVVDADLAMADLPTDRGPDLHDVLAGRADAVEAVSEGGPVAVLPCGRSLTGARACDPTALVAAVEAVRDEYGRVVVDCPAGMCGDVGLGLLVAEACVLVTQPAPPALGDALRARALARELDAGLAAIVLNRASEASPTELVARELGGAVATVPESAALADAQAAGVPVAVHRPDSPAAEALADLADTVERACRTRKTVS